MKLIKALISTGGQNEVESYDVDFDHQFLETEKYDAKPTYKKFLGYRPGIYVIGDFGYEFILCGLNLRIASSRISG